MLLCNKIMKTERSISKMRFFINVNKWNDKLLYSAPINGKSVEGEECVYFLNVRFAKCEAPTQNVRINVDYGFMSAYTKNDGNVVPELIVLKWTEVENNNQETETQPQKKAVASKKTTTAPKAEIPKVEVPLTATEEDLPF